MPYRILIIALLLFVTHAHAEQPDRFGFGRTPSADEIRLWDIDIMPDGRQLPPGRGTAEQGQAIYTAKCSSCHGAEGQGGTNDRLVGAFKPVINFATDLQAVRTIGNYWPYATTLYDYIYRAMPHTTPGTLSPDEVYALVAYLLYRNDVIDQNTEMNADSLPQVAMPARQLFYCSDEVEK